METKMRSWIKSITWRVTGVVILGGISYSITRDLAEMTKITLIFHFIRFVLYYYHERIWNKVDFGRLKPSKDDWTI